MASGLPEIGDEGLDRPAALADGVGQLGKLGVGPGDTQHDCAVVRQSAGNAMSETPPSAGNEDGLSI